MNSDSDQNRAEGHIIVREATIEDTVRMGEIAVDAWTFAYASFLPAEFLAARNDPVARGNRMREAWGDGRYRLVGLDPNGRVTGFAIAICPSKLEGYDCEIEALYVDPKTIRGGIGQRMVEEMVIHFTAQGHRSMAIHTLAENVISCSFYAKIGGTAGPFTTWFDFPSRWFVWPNIRESFSGIL